MKKGQIASLLKDIEEQVKESGITVLSQHGRREEIVRRRILAAFKSEMDPKIKLAISANSELGDAVDNLYDTIVETAKKDGMDLDGDLLDLLATITGDLYAIQMKLNEVKKSLDNPI
jgi:hypothetical protein